MKIFYFTQVIQKKYDSSQYNLPPSHHQRLRNPVAARTLKMCYFDFEYYISYLVVDVHWIPPRCPPIQTQISYFLFDLYYWRYLLHGEQTLALSCEIQALLEILARVPIFSLF